MICRVVLLTDMKCSPLVGTIEEYIKFLLIVSYEFVHGVKAAKTDKWIFLFLQRKCRKIKTS